MNTGQVSASVLDEQRTTISFRSRLTALYHKNEKYAGIAIFGIGFIWDSFTMTRVDNMIDNVILLFYFLIIGAMIVLALRKQAGRPPAGLIKKLEPHFLWAMQFCFGGLFSSYVIFYFKSASWTRTQFFFLILVFLWVGNEFLHERLQNTKLLAVLYTFCLLSFLAFFLPVILARVDTWIFLLAGLLSTSISFLVFSLGLSPRAGNWWQRMLPLGTCILATCFGVNLLYFSNLIPPVPLALKSAGIYHEVAKTAAGYSVKYVPQPFYRFSKKWDDPFYFLPGESVYCFTSIFAPGGIRVPVRHVWSRRTQRGWERTDRIAFQISGGREGGYRGFTRKSGISAGDWRVEVETESGQTLGRIDFRVLPGSSQRPQLITKLIS
jgi:hypothetical protein